MKNNSTPINKKKIVAMNSKIINTGATNNAKLQAYKKAVINKATQEINKIEEDIKNLEKNKI